MQPQPEPITRASYIRPITLSIAFSVAGELVIFVVWGLILFPEGSIFNKLVWTLGFCGIGMGSAVGAAVVLFVVDRLDGLAAVLATAGIAVALLGVACNSLCLALDRHFLYFGGAEDMTLFLANGIAMAAVGGLVVGWLCFTDRGRRVLRFGPRSGR